MERFANISDARAYAMCRMALERLASDAARVRHLALENIARWEETRSCHPFYPHRWRALLAGSDESIRTILMADTDEGQALRANNPFAGLFDRADRNRIRDAARTAMASTA